TFISVTRPNRVRSLRLAGLLPRFPPDGLLHPAPVPLRVRTSNLHGELLSVTQDQPRLTLVYQMDADDNKFKLSALSAFMCGQSGYTTRIEIPGVRTSPTCTTRSYRPCGNALGSFTLIC